MGVRRVLKFDPEPVLGTFGQFVYDLFCILHARKQDYDLIYQLGYTSNSVWWWLLPKKAVIVTNMDGLEWRRTKYSRPIQKFLRYAESLAVSSSDYLISDSHGIKEYLHESYMVASEFLPYGASVFTNPNPSRLDTYSLRQNRFSMVMARLEPENNIEPVIDGYLASRVKEPLLVIGSLQTKHGRNLQNKYRAHQIVRFLGGIYDIELLNNLRYFAKYYFHGHSVGGTNPSLLEAMGSSTNLIAHDNPFNRHILGEDAEYFKNSSDVADILSKDLADATIRDRKAKNLAKVKNDYDWEKIIEAYKCYFLDILQDNRLDRNK